MINPELKKQIDEALLEIKNQQFWVGFGAGFISALALVCLICWAIVIS